MWRQQPLYPSHKTKRWPPNKMDLEKGGLPVKRPEASENFFGSQRSATCPTRESESVVTSPRTAIICYGSLLLAPEMLRPPSSALPTRWHGRRLSSETPSRPSANHVVFAAWQQQSGRVSHGASRPDSLGLTYPKAAEGMIEQHERNSSIKQKCLHFHSISIPNDACFCDQEVSKPAETLHATDTSLFTRALLSQHSVTSVSTLCVAAPKLRAGTNSNVLRDNVRRASL